MTNKTDVGANQTRKNSAKVSFLVYWVGKKNAPV